MAMMRMATIAGEPGAGIDAAVLPRQQQLQRQRQRQRLADRIDRDPHRHAVVPNMKNVSPAKLNPVISAASRQDLGGRRTA